MDLVLGALVLEHGIQQVGGDGQVIHLAGLIHAGGHAVGLGVVGLADLVDQDVVLVPVGGVLGEHALVLRLKAGQDVGAVVQQAVGIQTELVAHLLQEGAVHRHEGGVGQHAQEERAGLIQRVDQRVVIHGLDADVLGLDFLHDLDGIAVRIGGLGAVLALQQVGGVVIVGLGVVYHRAGVVHVLAAGIVDGVIDVLGGGDPVVGGDVRHFLAVLVHPLHALADVEGPLGHVLVALPALGQRRNDVAVAVIFHKAVHHVGADGVLVGGGGGQVVQGGDFAGIQRAEGLGLRRGIAAGRGAGGGAATAGRHAQSHRPGQTQRKDFLAVHHGVGPFSPLFQFIPSIRRLPAAKNTKSKQKPTALCALSALVVADL